MADYALFGWNIEVDQDIAAEDQVYVFQRGHAGIIQHIDAIEIDSGFDFGIDEQALRSRGEIFLLEVRSEISSAVIAIDTLFGMSDGAFIQVGRKNFEGPSIEFPTHFFQQDHAQRVRFFAGGAPRAPYPQMAQRHFVSSCDDASQNNVAESVQLGLVPEKAGFADGAFIQKADEFRLSNRL